MNPAEIELAVALGADVEGADGGFTALATADQLPVIREALGLKETDASGLKLDSWESAKKTGLFVSSGVKKGENLFPRLDLEESLEVLEKIAPGKKEDETEPEEEVPIVEFDDFLKLRLQIGTVINAESIPKAKKLLKLEVDFGKEQRQIVSGIAKQYQPDELVGKQFVFVTNLKPPT